MWTLRSQPGWKPRELRVPRKDRENDETRDTAAGGGSER